MLIFKQPMNEEKLYLLALSQIKGIGDVLARRLLQHFGSAQAIFEAPRTEWKHIEGLEKKYTTFPESWDRSKAAAELQFIEQNQIAMHSFVDDSYPQSLKEIPDAPYLLFSQGACSLNIPRKIAIVGSRHNTAQGKQFTEELVAALKPYNPCIVSGLAYGIDIIAHKAALENGLQTIGVLAHGLDRIYPELHYNTAQEMKKNGALLTEYPSATIPDKQNFPSRNRIVSGMTDATIVIETAEKGGAMITAKLALSYNRFVFAVPGRYNDPRSIGCNYLIKTNIAQLITDAGDVVSYLNWDEDAQTKTRSIQQRLFATLNAEEQKIIDLIAQKTEMHIDELQIKTGFDNSRLAAILLQLEFANAIQSLPGKRYTL
jgi:DNA processing protein